MEQFLVKCAHTHDYYWRINNLTEDTAAYEVLEN